ncbi:hypothetical protein GCM10028774_62170 [Spirosoma jeollabukense]
MSKVNKQKPRYSEDRQRPASNDPIGFKLHANKNKLKVGELVEITVTARYLSLHPSMLFTFDGANAFRLKVIVPEEFVITGGTYHDYIGDQLSADHPVATYTIQGYFTKIPAQPLFRLLRGTGQADPQSLFADKGELRLQLLPAEKSAARIGGGDYRSSFDYANCSSIGGWILDYSSTQESISVDIYLNGTMVATVLANTIRQDVANAFGINGYNQYGFNWNIPSQYKTGAPITVSVKAAGSTYQLASSPRTTETCAGSSSCTFTPTASVSNASPGCGSTVTLNATCAGADCSGVSYTWTGNGLNAMGSSVTTTVPATNGNYTYTVTAAKAGCTNQTATTTVTVSNCGTGGDYRSNLDYANCEGVGGWVFDNNSTHQSLSVDIYLNGTKAATVLANTTRQDVANAYGISGYNQYGFNWPLPAQYKTGAPITVSVKAAGSTYELIASPRTTETCAGSPGCTFTPTASVSNASPGCGGTVTLNATCAGADCSGVSYTWTGNGLNATGSSVTTTVPATNGNYTYTVTAAKAGCTPATSSVSIGVTCSAPTSLSVGCYTIKSQKTGQPLQAMADGSIKQQASNGQPNQVWQVDDAGNSQFKFTPRSSTGQVIKVNDGTASGEQLSLGAYSGDDRQKWFVQKDVASGAYRVYRSNGITWDQNNYGNNPEIQLYGTTAESAVDFRLFRFDATTCNNTSACDFTISASPVSATCGQSIQVMAVCNGTGVSCENVSYNWLINGNTVSGQSATFNAPTGNGSTNYTVTATKAGCASKTAVATVTVSNCPQSSGYVPDGAEIIVNQY